MQGILQSSYQHDIEISNVNVKAEADEHCDRKVKVQKTVKAEQCENGGGDAVGVCDDDDKQRSENFDKSWIVALFRQRDATIQGLER